MNNIMIDIETLGTNANSAIVAISAVKFNIQTAGVLDVLDQRVNLHKSIDQGFEIETDTLLWWLKQDKKAINTVFFSGNTSLINCLIDLEKFIGIDDIIWANSPNFDLLILKSAFERLGRKIPWSYRNERCVRTLAALRPDIKRSVKFSGTKHTPLYDCYYQIKLVSEIWKCCITF